eukprot:4998319-Prymnesium_polylepis.1
MTLFTHSMYTAFVVPCPASTNHVSVTRAAADGRRARPPNKEHALGGDGVDGGSTHKVRGARTEASASTAQGE